MNELQNKYGGMTPSDFLKNHLPVFEKYLIKLESNRKTFVWRSGAIEDAILSSENSTIIFELLVSTKQETTEGMTPYSEPPKPGNVDELKDIGNGSQELKKKPDNSLSPQDVLKLKLKERLDENTRKQFSVCLNDVREVKNFLEFIAREDPKPDEMQYSDSHESDNSPSGHAESKGSSISWKAFNLLFWLILFLLMLWCAVSNGGLSCHSQFPFSYEEYFLSSFLTFISALYIYVRM